jgi:hypothetical protein
VIAWSDHTVPSSEENAMNPTTRNLLAAFALVTAATAAPAHAGAVDCAKPKDRGEARGCEAAVQGVDALRQFVHRSRAVYNLYIMDFASAVPVKVATEDKRPMSDAVASR